MFSFPTPQADFDASPPRSVPPSPLNTVPFQSAHRLSGDRKDLTLPRRTQSLTTTISTTLRSGQIGFNYYTKFLSPVLSNAHQHAQHDVKIIKETRDIVAAR
ncbi:hypothetical protein Hypma_004002 [Hypsizygus marmoreus]|uniref:Uncharacterized protein n=1 Tax=Hypsizygus marmoreus TaxID=39966 RepID=A0A369J0X0_HYPMA|nr:hypothetical protein Hypma_004002 [Hypsizygus marmoreus]